MIEFLISLLAGMPLIGILWFFIFRKRERKFSRSIVRTILVYHAVSLAVFMGGMFAMVYYIRTDASGPEMLAMIEKHAPMLAAGLFTTWQITTQGLIIIFGLPVDRGR